MAGNTFDLKQMETAWDYEKIKKQIDAMQTVTFGA